jgi:flagellar basal-body rod protein FlgC
MSLEKVFGIAASGMSAQQVRLNTTASNMANADNVGSSPDTVYKAKVPLFEAVLSDQLGSAFETQGLSKGVQVKGIADSPAAIEKRFQPGHPMADENGYVYVTNVNTMEELANMISASRDYQTNVEVMNTSKSLMMQTLDILKD